MLSTSVIFVLSQAPAFAQGGDAPSLAGNAPPPAAGAAPATATGAPGTASGAGPAAGPGGAGNYTFLIVMFAFLILWIVMITMGQRRESKKRQSLLDSLKKHDRVQTTGGLIGTIVEIKPDTIVLKVDENSNTRVTFARAAIVGVVKEAPAAAAEPSRS